MDADRGRSTAYTAMPAVAHTARYEPANTGTACTPSAWTRLMTAGAAPGSIAAIIAAHTTRNTPNGPTLVATPMSIPFICQTTTTQQAAAGPSVTVSAATLVAVLAPAGAAGRETGPAPAGAPARRPTARRRQDPSP